MIRAGIVGAAGYTGGEMLRLLLNHPQVKISFIQSTSNAGKPVYKVHQDLFGESERRFDPAINQDVDVIFLCLGHGQSREFLSINHFDPHVRVIDLSQDYRIQTESAEQSFVYGLPELNRDQIRKARYIANPGCFATAIQLALLPLAAAGLLDEAIEVSAVTGSTGAGQALSATTHFSWRENNLSVYKPFTHQHLGEIRQTLSQLQPRFNSAINFIPYRGDFTRGIIASVHTPCSLSSQEVTTLYSDYYRDHPFTWVTSQETDLKQVVNTNKAFLNLHTDAGRLLIVSVLDNLLKGASGQAVQNMNLLFGFPEDLGLRLKASAF